MNAFWPFCLGLSIVLRIRRYMLVRRYNQSVCGQAMLLYY